MALYIERFFSLTAWMTNPNPNPNSDTPIETTKSSVSYSPANTMTSIAPKTTETGTQVQVSTPKSKSKTKPISVTTTTIETQTIDNPELLAYTDEQLIGHYTTEIFQPHHDDANANTNTNAAPVDTTYTCCVCLETLIIGDKNTTLTPCGHAYHLSCLLSSLRNKNLCPMCRGSLEEPRPKPSTTNILRPANAEQIIRDELYWFPKSSYIQNIRGSNHPRRAFKEAARTFAYSVLQSAAEFVHEDNVPEEWYSEDDTENESDDSNSENTDGENENTDNDNDNDNDTENENENENENDNDNDNDTENENENENENEETDNQSRHVHHRRVRHIHLDEAHVNRTRGVNTNTNINLRLRSSSRGSDFDLRDELP